MKNFTDERSRSESGRNEGYTSILAAIELSQRLVGNTLSTLTTIAPRPADAAGIGRVCSGSHKGVQAVIDSIGSPGSRLLEFQAELGALLLLVSDELRQTGTQELPVPLRGRAGKYPQWAALAALAEPTVPLGALLAGGVELLRALHGKESISKSAAADVVAAIKDTPLSDDALRLLLDGTIPQDDISASWHSRLQRSWRPVVRYFAAPGTEPPRASFVNSVIGQILSSSVYASPVRSAGASDRHQLSPLQTAEVFAQISRWIEADDFRGAYGFFIATTGLTTDLVGRIPLQSTTADPHWVVLIDVATGCSKMDFRCVPTQAASADMNSTIAASYICTKPMPADLASALVERLRRYPKATCLMDLYPEATELSAEDAIIPCSDEIKPSWARLRRCAGTLARHIGVDNLLVSMLSGDFAHVPRSKAYYAAVDPNEFLVATVRLYRAAGWCEPVAMPLGTLAFGCRVVPTAAQIQRLDQWWLMAVNSRLPGKRCSLPHLMAYHNDFMRITGFRLALLLALRERKQCVLRADMDERTDLWIPIDDKDVPGFSGALPVPLTRFSARTIGAVRGHCQALASRLRQQGHQYSLLAKWCNEVVRRQTVSLLMLVSSPNELQPLGTHDFLSLLPEGTAVAPDFGRKYLENALRDQGLRTGDIDAVLRHSVRGQSSANAVSDFHLLHWLNRVTPVMDGIATDLLGEVCFGLARE